MNTQHYTHSCISHRKRLRWEQQQWKSLHLHILCLQYSSLLLNFCVIQRNYICVLVHIINIQTIQYTAKCLSKINENWESQIENLKIIERDQSENVDPQYLLGYRDVIGVQQRAMHRFSYDSYSCSPANIFAMWNCLINMCWTAVTRHDWNFMVHKGAQRHKISHNLVQSAFHTINRQLVINS